MTDVEGSRPDHGVVVFLHAHPDDEAIFTGGTLRLLADAGWTTVVVFATGGELGAPPADAAGASETDVAAHRRQETSDAARELGVSQVEFLGYEDSGLPTDGYYRPAPGSLCDTTVQAVAARLVGVLQRLAPTTLVTYDPHGIYGHPDHVMVHRAGALAAAQIGLPTWYECTVDREYLHFVETHLVEEAKAAGVKPMSLLGAVGPADTLWPAGALGLAASGFGTPTVEVDLVVDVGPALGTKRAAMAAHASQIPSTSSALQLDTHAFGEVYGLEWYLRVGPPGPLDTLPRL